MSKKTTPTGRELQQVMEETPSARSLNAEEKALYPEPDLERCREATAKIRDLLKAWEAGVGGTTLAKRINTLFSKPVDIGPPFYDPPLNTYRPHVLLQWHTYEKYRCEFDEARSHLIQDMLSRVFKWAMAFGRCKYERRPYPEPDATTVEQMNTCLDALLESLGDEPSASESPSNKPRAAPMLAGDSSQHPVKWVPASDAVTARDAHLDETTVNRDQTEAHPERWLRQRGARVHKLVTAPGGMERFRRRVLEWAEGLSQHLTEIEKWEADRHAHEARVRGDPRLQDEKAGPPEPGWEFEFYPKWRGDAKACRLSDRQEVDVPYSANEGVGGWTPPQHLRRDWPEYELPLPLSKRSLTIVEKYAVLGAIHDGVYMGVELINPWLANEAPDDLEHAIEFHATDQVYTSLIEEARYIPKDAEESIDALLDDVEADAGVLASDEARATSAEAIGAIHDGIHTTIANGPAKQADSPPVRWVKAAEITRKANSVMRFSKRWPYWKRYCRKHGVPMRPRTTRAGKPHPRGCEVEANAFYRALQKSIKNEELEQGRTATEKRVQGALDRLDSEFSPEVVVAEMFANNG